MIENRPPRASVDALPFWEGCDRGELLNQRCDTCGHVNWFPRSFCRQCSASSFTWERSTGRGVLESFSVVYRAMNEDLRDEVPYTLALVRIEEGPLLVTRLVGDDALTPDIGAVVEVRFLSTSGHHLPVFELV